jgi:hypothetical protein
MGKLMVWVEYQIARLMYHSLYKMDQVALQQSPQSCSILLRARLTPGGSQSVMHHAARAKLNDTRNCIERREHRNVCSNDIVREAILHPDSVVGIAITSRSTLYNLSIAHLMQPEDGL